MTDEIISKGHEYCIDGSETCIAGLPYEISMVDPQFHRGGIKIKKEDTTKIKLIHMVKWISVWFVIWAIIFKYFLGFYE